MQFLKKMNVAAIVVVLYAAGTAMAVKTAIAAPPGGVSGIITQVGSDSVSIKIANGKVIAIKINEATVVKVNGQAVKAADLKADMKAMVIGNHLSAGNPATEIRAYTPQSATTPPTKPGGVSGIITQVGGNSVSIKLGNGQVVAININDATVVKVNGQAGKAADLQVGMKAMVIGQHLSRGNPATEIRAYSPKTK